MQAFRRFLQLTKLEDSIFDILEKLDVDDNDALNATADLVKSMVSSAVMPEVIKKEIKQTQETMDLAPADREDIREECAKRLAVLKEFAPAEMSEEEIRAQISAVLSDLGIGEPTGKDKGKIMKELMPRVKGRADGALVNRLVGEALK